MNALIPKLIEAKKQFKPFLKNRAAHNYNYADLDELVSKSIDGLSSQGLLVYFTMENIVIADKLWLAINAHLSDGENEMKTTVQLPIDRAVNAKVPAHEIGGVITYGRRYAYCALLNLTAEEDTDGIDQSSDDMPEPHRRPKPARELGERPSVIKPKVEKEEPKEKSAREYAVEIFNYITIHGRPTVASALNILEDDIPEIKNWNLKKLKDGVDALFMLLGPLQKS